MATSAYKSEESNAAFRDILPPTKLVNNQNLKEARDLILGAYRSFTKEGVESKAILSTLEQMLKSKDVQASFGVYDAKKEAMIYSVRLESDEGAKIITLRVGRHFTELSLEKNGKLIEIMREENNQITHEKME